MPAVDQHAPPAAKVALFRSLFRGRDDVYPRRFESARTGKSGYAPACANEWVQGVCEKPRVKCADCPNRRFLPLSDDVIRWHLSGRDDSGQPFVAGIYPLLLDETCFFLAADFDKDGWHDDARSFVETAHRLQLPAAIERSRSGRGAHVWLFFDSAVPAAAARKLGAVLLTETMERRPDLGLDSYDRFFPNQDTLPQGGFGNLIALPLQKKPRERGNSVFLNEDLQPFADQWAFLSTIRKISTAQLDAVVRDRERRGHVTGVRFPVAEDDDSEPWLAPPSRQRRALVLEGVMPAAIELVVGDAIYVSKAGLPPTLRNHLVRLAAFQNPEFYRAQAMRLSTYGKPRIVGCAEEHSEHVALPRGCLDDLQSLLTDLNVATTIRDERNAGRSLDVCFTGVLRPDQQAAAKAMLAHDTGVLAATTAFGKTVVGAWLIAQRGVNTLVLVHRRQLLEQWIDRLTTFLDVDRKSIGRIGGGQRKARGLIDVAVIQSLVRKGVVDDCVGEYGHLVVDECHHLSAHSFEQAARRAKAKFVLGLSATVARKDGHHPIIFMQCGPVRHRVNAKEQAALRPFDHTVIVRPTSFVMATDESDGRVKFNALSKGLADDAARNQRICEDVLESVRQRRSPLVLTERNEHLDELARRLAEKVKHVVVLRGGMGRKELRGVTERLASIAADEDRVLVATGKYIGEGFDDPRLDTLFVTLPVSWRGTVAQYVGRLHRLYEGKRHVTVYDYADLNVPMLARMFDRRCRGYEAVGYQIVLPASAIPGWPADVLLPADPVWKRDYAATVRRLVRDGVDVPLAVLFMDAARPAPQDVKDAGRARSASEAFLYRRLQTLRDTAQRFRLNAALSLPFDGMSQMEVDLLCDDARVVVEIDGRQHLGDAEAYRRDRRKDRLLQENGFVVLRFLAEDIARDLDAILDGILRSVTARSRPIPLRPIPNDRI